MARSRLKAERHSEEDETLDARGCQRSEDRRERAPERVTDEEWSRASDLARDHRDAFGYGFGVLIQPAILRAICLRRPFEEIDVQAFSEAAANCAYRWSKVPDVGPFDRRRDDKQMLSFGVSGIVAEMPKGPDAII